eukprot:Em0003g1875a
MGTVSTCTCHFSLVLLIQLREKKVQQANTFEDLLYHRNATLKQATAKEVEDSEGSNVLLIFDGFDELPSDQRQLGSLFLDIINGFHLSKATIVITSRPVVTAELLTRYLIENGLVTNEFQVPKDLRSLPGEVSHQFVELCKVAFNGLCKQKLTWDDLPSDFHHLGFMTKSSSILVEKGPEIHFNSLHLTIQEFVAAVHVSYQPSCKQQELYQLYGHLQHFQVLWRFVAGLTKFRGLRWSDVLHKHLAGAPDWLKVDYCIQLPVYTACTKHRTLRSALTSMGLEGVSLLSMMASTIMEKMFALKLYNCSLDGAAYDRLAECVVSFSKLEELDLGTNPASEGSADLHALATLVRHVRLKTRPSDDLGHSNATTAYCFGAFKLGVY